LFGVRFRLGSAFGGWLGRSIARGEEHIVPFARRSARGAGRHSLGDLDIAKQRGQRERCDTNVVRDLLDRGAEIGRSWIRPATKAEAGQYVGRTVEGGGERHIVHSV
jgi:hypothetical protein